jgi:hypothetical protein
MPSYTVTHNLPSVTRGDTVLTWTVRIEREVPLELVGARCQLRDSFGALIYDWPLRVSGDTIYLASIPDGVTARFPVGVLTYDLEVRYPAFTRTYLTGTLEVFRGTTTTTSP